MQKIIKIVLIAALILFNPVTGLLFWFLGMNGMLVQWESLGTPPEAPVKILAVNARDTNVFVKTLSGQVYECCSGNNSSLWVQRTENEIHGFNFTDCRSEPDKGKHIRDEIDNFPAYWCGEFGVGSAYYAIRKDGSVLVWKDAVWFPNWVFQLFCYPGIGLILSMIIFTTLKKIIKRKTT